MGFFKSMGKWNVFTTVEPVLNDHTKINKTISSLMKVERIAECSTWNILQYV